MQPSIYQQKKGHEKTRFLPNTLRELLEEIYGGVVKPDPEARPLSYQGCL
jgi:hypothetical protein